ncbi:MAG TPA: helix-turn-helix transcriptional regulator [Phycisphaerae bacterium]|nr:helix-turn-helix transcriptional regulator [Phycisphaerae bacterium]
MTQTRTDPDRLTRLVLKVARLEAGRRQIDICREFGFAKATYHRIENGPRAIFFEDIRELCLYLGIEPTMFWPELAGETIEDRTERMVERLRALQAETAAQRRARRQKHTEAA